MATEHVDVLIVGAGLSGIGAAHYLQTRCPRKSFAILEARDSIGGTWDLFRYPGVRSDSDMFTLGFSFRPWRDAKAIADGPAILAYIKETAHAYGIDRKIRFGHRVRRAEWSSADAAWTVEAEAADGTVRLTCNFLYLCTGYYDYAAGYMPQWPDMDQFGGRIVHPQHWPENLDYAGKRVLLIGSGATVVTLAPAMAPDAAHVTMLQRSPTYIVSQPGRDSVADTLRGRLPHALAYRLVRWKNVLVNMFYYTLMRRQPEAMKRNLVQMVQKELGPDYDVATHFTPRYNPWDQRLCLAPDGDFFAAIRSGKVSVATGQIDCFTPAGVRLRSGEELPADIIVAATGLVVQLGGGMQLAVDGAPVDMSKAMQYRGAMFSDIPNLAVTIGYTNASWTLRAELIAGYVTQLLNYMDRHGYAQCTPRRRDGSIAEEPILNLNSGYIQRAAPVLPHQGSKRPWKQYQNYVLDLLTYRLGKVDDGTIEFRKRTQPAAAPARGALA